MEHSDSILFANDNPSFLMYVGILVKRLGYKVHLALDGMEAVKIAKDQLPTIIVLDYALPGIDGQSCLNLIRNDAFLRDIPVLMLCAAEDNLSGTDPGKMNVQGFLKKPLDVTDFYLAIQKCLRHSIMRRHIRAHLSMKVGMTCNGVTKELSASNLSVEGIFLRTIDPLPIGTEMVLTMKVADEEPIELKGTVVSSKRICAGARIESGMGIRFADMPEDLRYRLNYLVIKELTKDISVGNAGETWIDDRPSSV
jgi:uncharacterized protein (TIGR02266 family)